MAQHRTRFLVKKSQLGLGLSAPAVLFGYARSDFAQKAKSRGGTLVTHAYIKKSYLRLKRYSQYARNNLDLLEQGPHGIVG